MSFKCLKSFQNGFYKGVIHLFVDLRKCIPLLPISANSPHMPTVKHWNTKLSGVLVKPASCIPPSGSAKVK